MARAIQNVRDHRLAIQAVFSAVALAGALAHARGKTAGEKSVVASTEAPQPDRTKSASTKVIEVYRSRCLECHDVDGRGGVAREGFPQLPDFTDSKWHASRSDAELSRSILEGKGKSMPKMKNKLGSVDAKQMVAFVRGFKDGKQVVEDESEVASEAEKRGERAAAPIGDSRPGAASVAKRTDQVQRGMNRSFQRFCAMCHGGAGDGSNARDTLKVIPNFTNPTWQDKRTDSQLTVSILDGKGTEMPPFRSKLTRDQARELVAFIRGFSHSPRKQSQKAADDFDEQFRLLVEEFMKHRRQSRALSSPAQTAPAGPAAKDSKL
jgi:mono/diheme cytochrome c family protein